MKFDFAAIVVGLPGFGKTTLQSALVRRHLRETPGIVLMHDPVRQFVEHGCTHYADVAAYRRAAAEAARTKQPMNRGASIGGVDSDDIVKLALELGQKLNTAKHVRVPIFLGFDEGSLRDGSGATYTGKLDNQLLAIRRHAGVAPVFNLQEYAQVGSRFYRGMTDVYLFRQTADRAQQLDSILFLEKGTLQRHGIVELPKHRYVHVRVGEGVVGDAL